MLRGGRQGLLCHHQLLSSERHGLCRACNAFVMSHVLLYFGMHFVIAQRIVARSSCSIMKI